MLCCVQHLPANNKCTIPMATCQYQLCPVGVESVLILTSNLSNRNSLSAQPPLLSSHSQHLLFLLPPTLLLLLLLLLLLTLLLNPLKPVLLKLLFHQLLTHLQAVGPHHPKPRREGQGRNCPCCWTCPPSSQSQKTDVSV